MTCSKLSKCFLLLSDNSDAFPNSANCSFLHNVMLCYRHVVTSTDINKTRSLPMPVPAWIWVNYSYGSAMSSAWDIK